MNHLRGKQYEVNNMKMRGARILIEALRCENVKHIFGYPGGAVLHV
jgi:hypothetical protein